MKSCLLNFFWRREHRSIQKRMCSKIIIRIFFKKKSPLKEKKLISRFTRVEDCVREWRPSWPLLRVVTLLRESSLCAFSCHASRPRDIRCIKPSLSFFSAFLFLWKASLKTKCSVNVFLYPFVLFPIFRTLFWLLWFDFSPKSKISWFHFLVFTLMFPVLFLSSCFCQGDLMAEDETRHQEKWVKWVVTMVNKVWKGGLLLACFFSMNEGLSWWTWINQGECLGWWFLARFGSNSVFVVIEWVVCDTDSSRDTRKWMLIIISLCFLSLSLHFYSLYVYPPFPQHLAKSYWKDWATWGGEAELGGFDGLWRRSKEEDRARKTKSCGKTTQWHGRENKQTGR